MSKLTQLPSITQASSPRVGRGYGSGRGGHTVGRGTKGQRSRAGGQVPLWFEGGQLPLIKRLPMWRGKGRLKPTSEIWTVRLGQLANLEAELVTLDSLQLAGLVPKRARRVKLIAGGALNRAIKIRGIMVSQGARASIERVGGSVVE